MSLARSRAIALVLSSTPVGRRSHVTPRLVLPGDDRGAHFVGVENYLLRPPQRAAAPGPQHPHIAPDQRAGVLYRLETSAMPRTSFAQVHAERAFAHAPGAQPRRRLLARA